MKTKVSIILVCLIGMASILRIRMSTCIRLSILIEITLGLQKT